MINEGQIRAHCQNILENRESSLQDLTVVSVFFENLRKEGTTIITIVDIASNIILFAPLSISIKLALANRVFPIIGTLIGKKIINKDRISSLEYPALVEFMGYYPPNADE